MERKYQFSDGEIKMPEFNFGNITKKTGGIIAAVLVALWFMSGIYFVGPQEAGVVKRFGKFVSITNPGPHFHMPWPIETVDKPKVREQKRLEIGFRTVRQGPPAQYSNVDIESLMLTGDENIVDVKLVVQYIINDPVKYLFRIKNQDATIRKAAESAIRFVIGKNNIDDALTDNKTGIQNDTQDKLQEILNMYDAGILISAIKLQDVIPPAEVAEAFKDVATAIQDKNRTINLAQGYNAEVIPKARGDGERVRREAEAYKESRVRRATGDIDRFNSILNEYSKAKNVTRTRLYLEAMEEILPGIEKYLVEPNGGGGVLKLLQLDKKGGN